MIPILCVGETIEEREEGEAQSKVQNQIQAGLSGDWQRTNFVNGYCL